jgi:hypothetical protein
LEFGKETEKVEYGHNEAKGNAGGKGQQSFFLVGMFGEIIF